MARKTFLERCKTTLAGQKARAKKYGEVIPYSAHDLVSIIPETCRWCTKRLTPAVLNFDHKISVARGGKWEIDNLEAICDSCNRKKGALHEDEFALLHRALVWITKETGSDYASKNILKRLAAGGAFIYG